MTNNQPLTLFKYLNKYSIQLRLAYCYGFLHRSTYNCLHLRQVFYTWFMRLFAFTLPICSLYRFWDLLLADANRPAADPSKPDAEAKPARHALIDLAFGGAVEMGFGCWEVWWVWFTPWKLHILKQKWKFGSDDVFFFNWVILGSLLVLLLLWVGGRFRLWSQDVILMFWRFGGRKKFHVRLLRGVRWNRMHRWWNRCKKNNRRVAEEGRKVFWNWLVR